MRTLLDAEPWKFDTKCSPIPWRQDHFDEISNRKLTIGLMVDDGVVAVHPPIKRVLGEVVQALTNAGHEVVDWEPIGHGEIIRIQVKRWHSYHKKRR